MSRAVRIAVVGNSVSVMMLPPRTRRTEGTYGELVADRLAVDGHDTHLALEGRWFDFATDALREQDERLRRHAPDVVVLHFGVNESQPWLAPIWLLRHLMTQHRTTTRTGQWYREHVAGPAWRGLRTYRRLASARVGERTWQVSPERFARAMALLVRAARLQLGALVLVVDITPPGDTLEHFLPGQRGRHARFQQVLADVVAAADDPDVRLVRASSAVEALGPEVATPDGIHFSAAGHSHVADLVEAEVRSWLSERGEGG